MTPCNPTGAAMTNDDERLFPAMTPPPTEQKDDARAILCEAHDLIVLLCSQINARIKADGGEGDFDTSAVGPALIRLATYLANAPSAPSPPARLQLHACTNADVIRGYQHGYDVGWCKVCGTITFCSDGIIPTNCVGRDDHSEWKASNLVAWSCTEEAHGRGKCKEWCGNQSYCTAAIKLWPAAIPAVNQTQGE